MFQSKALLAESNQTDTGEINALSSIDPLAGVIAPPLFPGRFDDGIIPISILENDVPFAIPRPPASVLIPLNSRLVLIWGAPGVALDLLNEVGLPYTVTAGDVANPPATFPLVMPSNVFPTSGVTTYQLAYKVRQGRFGVITYSDSVLITIDYRPPGGQDLPELLFERNIGTIVTPSDLVAGVLPSVVPDFYDMSDLDWVMPWIGIGDPPVGSLLPTTEEVQVPLGGAGQSLPIPFKREFIEALDDGLQAFSYRLRDKAGNISGLAPYKFLTVLLKLAPENFLAPLVPLFTSAGVLTDYNTRPGVVVQIPAFTNGLVGDDITVYWGSQVATSHKLTDISTNPFLPNILLPYTMILAAGDGDIDVWYTVSRSGELLGTSPVFTVVVDTSTPAGPDPDPTTPGNENLDLALVYGASDSAASPARPNIINSSDYGSNATAAIPWLLVDGNPYLLLNDVITLSWDGVEVIPGKTISATDIGAAAPVLITVPAAIITTRGSGEPLITYTVTRVLASGVSVGTSLSLATTVTVISTNTSPGGGGLLPQPEFPDAYPAEPGVDGLDIIGNVARDNGEKGTTLRIPVTYTNAAVLDELTWSFIGNDAYDGTGGLLPAGDTSGTHTVNPDDLALGYYDVLIQPEFLFAICEGSAIVTYSASNGETGNSARWVLGVYMSNWLGCVLP